MLLKATQKWLLTIIRNISEEINFEVLTVLGDEVIKFIPNFFFLSFQI